ncbi:NAD(P)-dependent oxidoreductase [Rhizobium pusense]|uniref:NAD-dependent epimerase/dehydratase family protein n=1 Tax=Agrobacterium pusense TaxID=648995 RepID=UPI000D1A049B|nr:NAD(P)-dependent oxidoreductase [Agrobacterium pusense]MDH0912531.1 NAD(P)-dependent oxidoreductase [Agrobacterium pusense]MDH1098622.1 NAD(P)-dependent oxidoreductase [Agrobacterium pusense]MDH1115219.1 NAD(P)-dependent oxidoreductase [Agrobacterium pusense]MDH2197030.1 NAD(P)-dependent oxidoreductase [Agrobacterium pusense]
MKRIAMTGGSGHIASRIRNFLRPEVDFLRLIDVRPPEALHDHEEYVEADLADASSMFAALRGVDAVIHFGGISTEAEFDDILSANICGVYNLYEAARGNDVRRIVLASSNHTVGFYPRTETVSPLDVPRPDSRYGLSKCWGELVAGYYFDTVGIRTLSIRIGNAADFPTSERAAAIWVSARDLWQLVQIGLTHPEIAAAVVFGASRSPAGWWRDEVAERLGYRPRDNASDFLRDEAPKESAVAGFFQGGPFCDPGHDGIIRLRDRDGLVERPETTQ